MSTVLINYREIYELKDAETDQTIGILRVHEDSSFTFDIITDAGRLRGSSENRLAQIKQTVEMITELMHGLTGLEDSEEDNGTADLPPSLDMIQDVCKELVDSALFDRLGKPTDTIDDGLSQVEKELTSEIGEPEVADQVTAGLEPRTIKIHPRNTEEADQSEQTRTPQTEKMGKPLIPPLGVPETTPSQEQLQAALTETQDRLFDLETSPNITEAQLLEAQEDLDEVLAKIAASKDMNTTMN